MEKIAADCILLITRDAGFGHRSASDAIAKSLASQRPNDSATVVVNPKKIKSMRSILWSM